MLNKVDRTLLNFSLMIFNKIKYNIYLAISDEVLLC